jgi:AcrR family transcriptional regulator
MSRKDPTKSRPGAGPTQKKRKPDARIRRTHERLGSSLVELIREQPMDHITVQHVLDRAKVGRSTFYLHFRGKHDLLLSQFEQFLEAMSTRLHQINEPSLRVMPVAEMFAHVGGQKKLYRALVESGQINDLWDLAPGYFARGIEQRLKDSKRLPNLPGQELTAQSVALAGSLLSLMRWWLDRGGKEPPADMDQLFHKMVWNGLR